jgi:hypothetical protein
MRVKMGWNSSGMDGNLHKVRVETARYGFCIRIFKLVTGIWKGQVRVDRGRCGSKRVNMVSQVFLLCLPLRVEGSVRVNQELVQVYTGWNESKQFTMRSAFRECSHTQPDLEPGQYGIKIGSTRTRIEPHRNPCQFLMDSESTMRRRKRFLVMFKSFTLISIP